MASPSALPSALRWPLDAAASPLSFTGSSLCSCRRESGRLQLLRPRSSSSSSDAATSSSSASPSSPGPRTARTGAFSREGLHPFFKEHSKSSTNSTDDHGGLIKGGKVARAPAAVAFSSGSADERSDVGFVAQMPGRHGSLKPVQRHPLWRRIFFASKKVRSIILLDVLTIIYASDIPLLKEVEAIVDPALFNMVRFVIAALPFLPFVLWARGDRKTLSSGIELGCWVSLGYLTQALGLLTSDAGRASFLSAFMVITVPLIDGLFGSTIPVLTWCGAIISLIGVCMLECSGSSPNVGDFLNMLSAVFFGIHILRTEHISRVTKKESYLSLLGYQVSVIALFSVAWYVFREMSYNGQEETLISWPSWDWIISFPWIPALYTGILTTGLCLWAEMSAMRDVTATETAIIYGLEPLWGAAFAWILLGERWDTVGWIGAALILSGSLTVQIFGSSPEKSKTDGGKRMTDKLNLSDGSKDLSLSPVVIDSRKRVRDLPDKKEK
ncbi:unnamed protein product [Spirodela intermedia]|uniref:EamA domain-containing protein n=1 Tax=Spirodela intermedia TaxID=51605 RepID=A0A7I8KV01_SPIIN|nr:unnamed protein product [Spirodela intermedia]